MIHRNLRLGRRFLRPPPGLLQPTAVPAARRSPLFGELITLEAGASASTRVIRGSGTPDGVRSGRSGSSASTISDSLRRRC
jgi:hypothetical protein